MLTIVREKPVCLDERRGGLLLPVASLPWGHGIGDLGSAARQFVDWVASCGLGLWQILPCTPLSYGWSPYSGSSAFAVEPLLLDLHDLVTLDLLRPAELPAEVASGPRIDYQHVMAVKKPLLELAARRLATSEESFWRSELRDFRKRQGDWLEDAALFFSLHVRHGDRPFWEWESAIASRQPRALRDARRELKGEVATQAALQLLADRQCQALRAHALARGVALIGDMPLYVARDSADCWARPELFALASPGTPRLVGGVPPDAFTATGQLWGNPCYDWSAHRAEGFAYWVRRIERAMALSDVVRLDHFRGLSACYEIPFGAQDATIGSWTEVPGQALVNAVRKQLGTLPLVAEDLGFMDEGVRRLRDDNQLMGMVVLQLAFDGDPKNEHLPHHHERSRIVYTGTHDNDTCAGWWAGASGPSRRQLRRVLRSSSHPTAVVRAMVHAAFASVARWAVVPVQDLLEQDSQARVNLPGSSDPANWTYRLVETALTPKLTTRIADLAQTFDRVSRPEQS